MPHRRSAWNLKRRTSEIGEWIHARPVNVEPIEEKLSAADALPQSISGRLDIELAVPFWHLGTYRVLTGPSDGWELIRDAVRCEAIHAKVYLDRIDQLVASDPRGARHRRLPIGRLAGTGLLRQLSSALSGLLVGEAAYGDWCGRRLLKSFLEPDYIADASDWVMWNEIPAFVLLLARWRDIELGELPRGIQLQSPYHEIFDAWNDDARFQNAVEDLCRYHESHCTGDEDPFFHPYEVFPVEILALRQIRREMGLYFPEKLEFAILQTPLAEIPASIPRRSNDYIPRVIAKCKTLMPLEVPWEEA